LERIIFYQSLLDTSYQEKTFKGSLALSISSSDLQGVPNPEERGFLEVLHIGLSVVKLEWNGPVCQRQTVEKTEGEIPEVSMTLKVMKGDIPVVNSL